MNHLSLFNGIGGFQLSAHWMGWNNVAHVEIVNRCNEIIKIIFPESQCLNDIKEVHGKHITKTIDIISGGDPCQPSSKAGLGKGKSDDRYLWPEMFRLIRILHPTWVVNENVDGTITNGILDIKIADLESEGYACQAYSIPAESVGALHQRERIWLIAYNANSNRNNKKPGSISKCEKEECPLEEKQHKIYESWEPVDLRLQSPDSNIERFEEQYFTSKPDLCPERNARYFGFGPYVYGNIPRNIIESAIIRSLDGLSEGLDYTRRNERIAEIGNAIVPQIAYEIFKAIQEYESLPGV